MRKKIVAGNWKMNKTADEAQTLVSEILQLLSKNPLSNQTVIICPPFVHLTLLSSVIGHRSSVIHLGAQNCHWEEKGAFTGEISAAMLKSCGAEYVIIGHSERRQYFKETNEQLSKKTELALKNNLIPIFCCGETLEERKSEIHFDIVKNQITEGLRQIFNNQYSIINNPFILAYEPVWAIGTGETATPQQAQEMHAFIRKILSGKFGNAAENISILYGGSCNAANAKNLFSQPDIDGGLIGGASLKAEEFVQIIHSF